MQYPPGSHSINYEISSVIYSVPLVKELVGDFARDLADCTEFDPVAYQKRGTMVRFRDSRTLLPDVEASTPPVMRIQNWR